MTSHGKIVGRLIALAYVCVLTTPLSAEDEAKAPLVQQIVESSTRVAYYQGKDGRAKVTMTITDSQGRTRQRKFTILRWDELPKKEADEQPATVEPGEENKRVDADRYCGDQKFYVYFTRPADVNKMVFMVWKHIGKDDDRWLYLPALDLVKRIAATDKRTSFVGSHFFYEDVSGRDINDDEHEIIETTKSYYVLKNTPTKPKTVEFSYYKMWVHRKTFVTVKVEYYDKQDKKYRVYEALKVENFQGYPTVTKARMKDLRTKGETVAEYGGVKYDISLPENIFTERYLRRPPTKYLR